MPVRSHQGGHQRACTGAILALAMLLCGCAPPPAPERLGGETMGTSWSVRLGALPGDLALDAVARAVEEELAAVTASMSTWDPESELSRFNAQATTAWIPVSAELAYVVGRALAVAELSGGALDVTAGPLVEAWGFGAGTDGPARPAADRLAAALERVDYRRLQVREEPAALRKLRPDLQIDLSAIAKGFAVDRIAWRLDAAGIDHYLVEIGGELRTRGRHPDGRAWRVGIERPDSPRRAAQRVVAMRANAAVATSGDYYNYFEADERRYGHLIDPRSGVPTSHALASVTVIADNCTDADALATALYVLGPQAGYELALERELAALFIIREDSAFAERATPRFARWLRDE